MWDDFVKLNHVLTLDTVHLFETFLPTHKANPWAIRSGSKWLSYNACRPNSLISVSQFDEALGVHP